MSPDELIRTDAATRMQKMLRGRNARAELKKQLPPAHSSPRFIPYTRYKPYVPPPMHSHSQFRRPYAPARRGGQADSSDTDTDATNTTNASSTAAASTDSTANSGANWAPHAMGGFSKPPPIQMGHISSSSDMDDLPTPGA
eukprot:4993990-Pleurochrysis_carterae.AAC.1